MDVELQVAAWVQFARTFGIIYRRMLKTIERNGITGPQFDVLATLKSSAALSQQELTGRLLVAKGNVATVCDHLERMGLIRRTTDPADARRKQVQISEAGSAILDKVRPHHRRTVRAIWSALTPEQLRSFQRALRTLERSASDHEA